MLNTIIQPTSGGQGALANTDGPVPAPRNINYRTTPSCPGQNNLLSNSDYLLLIYTSRDPRLERPNIHSLDIDIINMIVAGARVRGKAEGLKVHVGSPPQERRQASSAHCPLRVCGVWFCGGSPCHGVPTLQVKGTRG